MGVDEIHGLESHTSPIQIVNYNTICSVQTIDSSLTFPMLMDDKGIFVFVTSFYTPAKQEVIE